MPYKDKEKIAAYRRAYYEAHKEEIVNRSRAYRASHPEYSRPHKDVHAMHVRAWQLAHREESVARGYFYRLGIKPTPEILELKTQQIRLLRKIKEVENGEER